MIKHDDYFPAVRHSQTEPRIQVGAALHAGVKVHIHFLQFEKRPANALTGTSPPSSAASAKNNTVALINLKVRFRFSRGLGQLQVGPRPVS